MHFDTTRPQPKRLNPGASEAVFKWTKLSKITACYVVAELRLRALARHNLALDTPKKVAHCVQRTEAFASHEHNSRLILHGPDQHSTSGFLKTERKQKQHPINRVGVWGIRSLSS